MLPVQTCAKDVASALASLIEATTSSRERWVKAHGQGDGGDDDRYDKALPDAKRDLATAIENAMNTLKDGKGG